MGGQVEVNKEMVGMEREEMRVVLCEDDLESSQGGRPRREGGGEKRRGRGAQRRRREKGRYLGLG